MPVRRADGSPITGRVKPTEHVEGKFDKNTRLVSKNRQEIGKVPQRCIEEAGKTRVNRKNEEYKQAVKTWRLNSPFRRWRISNNLTIQEAADALGVPNITYQQWEYGRYSRINQTVTVNGNSVRFNESIAPIVGFTRAIHNSWVRSKPVFKPKAKSIRGKEDE